MTINTNVAKTGWEMLERIWDDLPRKKLEEAGDLILNVMGAYLKIDTDKADSDEVLKMIGKRYEAYYTVQRDIFRQLAIRDPLSEQLRAERRGKE